MSRSILRDVRGFSPSRNIGAVSANWLSTTTTASGVTRKPIVPPRAVNRLTLRRTSWNAGTVGGCWPAGACANSDRLPSAPSSPSDDVVTN